MAITIKDVAHEAGVSFSTVSKVINNSHEISEATAIKVKEVMKRLDYTPNARAASFRRKSTRNIAFLTPLKKGEAFIFPHKFDIICGVHAMLVRRGYNVTLVDISDDEKIAATIKSVISTGGYEGLIVHAWNLNTDAAAILVRGNFPYIVIGEPNFESQICWLDNNNVLAGGIAARHLADCGAKKMAFVGTPWESRLEGVCLTLKELGLEIKPEHICHTDLSVGQGYAVTLELLNSKNRPDGIICENTMIAIGVMKAINEIGLALPTDIQLITFDDYPFSRVIEPMPTVINIDCYDLGEQAASQLIKNIRNPALHVQSYITLPELIVRGTTRGAS
ncbi:MAG: LacI family transcriptional regulator [Lachnospiraceae bacterium]|nr:LacI family transcriptional regulator [Lachnospiraceae bacterium]